MNHVFTPTPVRRKSRSRRDILVIREDTHSRSVVPFREYSFAAAEQSGHYWRARNEDVGLDGQETVGSVDDGHVHIVPMLVKDSVPVGMDVHHITHFNGCVKPATILRPSIQRSWVHDFIYKNRFYYFSPMIDRNWS